MVLCCTSGAIPADVTSEALILRSISRESTIRSCAHPDSLLVAALCRCSGHDVKLIGFMTTDEVYSSDEGLINSPLLQPVQVKYTPEPSPPPFVLENSSSPSTSPSPESEESDVGLASTIESETAIKRLRRPKKRRRQRHKPSQGDTVLISYLAPNRPDIAQQASQTVLDSRSQSEVEDDEEDESGSDKDMIVVNESKNRTEHVQSETDLATSLAQKALQVAENDRDDVEMREAQQSPVQDKVDTVMGNGIVHEQAHEGCERTFTKPGTPPSLPKGLNIKPPPRSPRPPTFIKTESTWSAAGQGQEEDSTPISPSLAKYAMKPSDVDPDSVLPAIQKSPPRSDSIHSPEGTQSLPSLQTTLSQISDSAMNGANGASPYTHPSGHSPTFVRHSPHASQGYGPSPASYTPGMSPPGMPSHPSYWRTAPRAESMSTPSSYDNLTPASVPPGPSPAQSYPTPNIQDHRGSIDGSSTPQLINGPLSANGPFSSSAFKCTHAGCTAAPFQTQYLLNSHANVHSSSRPHFCPVPECPRGPGGKGFKRKNEMIRHGLVHQSPGYMW